MSTMTLLPTDAAATTGNQSYQDVFQHAHAMGIVEICLLIGFLLFLGTTSLAVFAAAKDAKRIQQARAAGKDFEKRTLSPSRRLIVPLVILTDVILIFIPVFYDGVIVQPKTVSAMQANVKEKYGAELQLVNVGPKQKLIQATAPDKPENFILTFPDGKTGTYSLRFDKDTSEPFILNPDGSVQSDTSGPTSTVDNSFPSTEDYSPPSADQPSPAE